MPGLTGATGGETSDSEAAIPLLEVSDDSLGVCDVAGVSSPDSPLIVDVEEERVKLCVKGARCVSLSLNILLVIFQDMVKGRSGVSWEEGVRFVGPG